jgi:hypothetical protein
VKFLTTKRQRTKDFGDPDAEQTAERPIYALYQGPTMSVVDLTAKFRQIAANLNWDDKALRSSPSRTLREGLPDIGQANDAENL